MPVKGKDTLTHGYNNLYDFVLLLSASVKLHSVLFIIGYLLMCVNGTKFSICTCTGVFAFPLLACVISSVRV